MLCGYYNVKQEIWILSGISSGNIHLPVAHSLCPVLFCPRDTEILITQSVPFESLNVDVGGENSAEEVVLIKNSPQSSTSPEAMKYANHMHHARTQQQQPQGALMFIVW